jgi:hypothetical protein
MLVPSNTGINTLSLSVRVAITVTFRVSKTSRIEPKHLHHEL